jgi:RNA polymerase sigma-70 factor (ECF subfamily)
VSERGRLIALRPPAGAAAEMSDAALLAACAAGEPAALGALFDRHHAGVHRFLARLRGADERDLDDLLNATFLEAYRGAARFRGEASARVWLLGVAANVARHHVRGEARRRFALARAAERPQPQAARPDDTAERRELIERLGHALGLLPYDQRVAFVLCELEEVPGSEAARCLGVRAGTLGRRLHEARRALRALIAGGGS